MLLTGGKEEMTPEKKPIPVKQLPPGRQRALEPCVRSSVLIQGAHGVKRRVPKEEGTLGNREKRKEKVWIPSSRRNRKTRGS